MKFFLGQSFLSILSVIILYYLFNTSTFTPYLENGGLNWQNIIVLIFFISVIIVNITSMIYVLINRYILKKIVNKKLTYSSFKVGGILVLGLLVVFLLNYLHILNFYYGLGVFAIVILILLVI
jgi:hypothetical protein